MSDDPKKITRRDFIEGAAGAAVVGTAGMTAFCHDDRGVEAKAPDPAAAKSDPAAATEPMGTEARSDKARSKVVLIRNEKVLSAGKQVQADVMASMLDDAVGSLTGETNPGAAWQKLFVATDTVGIKSNVWRFLGTPPELEAAIQKRLGGVGIPAERIAVDDRGVLGNPIFREATALVNVRPLRTHHWAGVGSCIKNYIMFSDNPAAWHDDACADLAGVWKLPAVAGKTRLNILVMLTPLFHGKGPHHFNAAYTWDYRGLIVGTDPVAVDATGVRILEAKRREHFGREQPFAVSPHHVRVAEEKHGLGVADPARIELVKLGWMDGVLI